MVSLYGLLLVQTPLYIPSVFRDPTTHGGPAAIPDIALTLADLGRLQGWGLSLPVYAVTVLLATVIFHLAYVAAGVLLFWRRADDRFAFVASFGLMMLPFGFAPITLGALPPTWRWIPPLASALGNGALIFCGYVFPDGWFRPRWAKTLGVGLLLCTAVAATIPSSKLDASAWTLLLFLGFALGVVPIQVYRYRAISSAYQRQQTKWVVWGMSLAVVGNVASRALYSFGLAPTWGVRGMSYGVQTVLVMVVMIAIPFSVGVAVFSSHLWDIDLVVHRTLVYGALSTSLAAIYVGSIIVLQTILHAFTAQQRPGALVITLSTLLVAAVTNPLRRWFQQDIDRRFYRSHYQKGRVLKAFADTLRHEIEINQLGEQLLTVVDETMHPAHLSLWLDTTRENSHNHSREHTLERERFMTSDPDTPGKSAHP